MRFLLTITFLSLSIFSSPQQNLTAAYLEFFHSPETKYSRIIDYSFDSKDKDFEGQLRWSQQDSNNFSLSFSLGLAKVFLTRQNSKLSLYTPHNKTYFTSTSKSFQFSKSSLLFTLKMMEPELAKIILNPKKALDKLTINQVSESEFSIYHVGRLLAEVNLDDGGLDEAKFYTQSGILKLEFKKSNWTYLVHRRSRAKTIHQVSAKDFCTNLNRGIARYLQIQYHELSGIDMGDTEQKGQFGSMTRKDDLRIIKLQGSSYDIGWQHGKFLAKESRRVIDSTLYLMGMFYSIKTGKWFMDDIRQAQTRLDKFTPPEYLEEMKGLADGAKISFEEVHLANYFPALFHCSGFTMKNEQTVDGVLYHGRVLDYMCQIGLQYENAIFIVKKDQKTPFVNVSFAGFIGSVSGMNEEKISLGEMGGEGEGEWDGISMPILMRMALENAKSLDDAKNIFANNPRTCEYYYIFADGKSKESVAVYAKPQKIEFLLPGEEHSKLPNPLPKCLLLASGSRYEALCEKASLDKKVGLAQAIALMDKPIASADNNLHSVLFIPEKLKLWISYAWVNEGAYARKFTELDLRKELQK